MRRSWPAGRLSGPVSAGGRTVPWGGVWAPTGSILSMVIFLSVLFVIICRKYCGIIYHVGDYGRSQCSFLGRTERSDAALSDYRATSGKRLFPGGYCLCLFSHLPHLATLGRPLPQAWPEWARPQGSLRSWWPQGCFRAHSEDY